MSRSDLQTLRTVEVAKLLNEIDKLKRDVDVLQNKNNVQSKDLITRESTMEIERQKTINEYVMNLEKQFKQRAEVLNAL